MAGVASAPHSPRILLRGRAEARLVEKTGRAGGPRPTVGQRSALIDSAATRSPCLS